MSQQDITLHDIHTLLSGFIQKQEDFNAKQESFNSKQESFNSKQEAFNAKQEAFNAKQESFNSRLEDKLDRFQEDEKANHNLSHRMIMQAYEYINDIKMDNQDIKQPWMKK